jgi:hypothetical protein
MQIEITHDHLDRAIEAQPLKSNCRNCILAQVGIDLMGRVEGAGLNIVNGHSQTIYFKHRRIAEKLTHLNDKQEWGKLNEMLPITLEYRIKQRGN